MRGLDRDSGQWTDKTLERGKVIRLKISIEGHQDTVRQWQGLASWRRAFEDAGRRRRGPPKSCLTAAGPESLFGLVWSLEK